MAHRHSITGANPSGTGRPGDDGGDASPTAWRGMHLRRWLVHRAARRDRRGQSLVEFALVLPLLLVLLFGLADFGRVFAAGITIEAAARNAAEAAAQEYLQLARNRPGGTLTPDDYSHVHDVARDRVCFEAETLPATAVPAGVTPTCIRDESGTDVGAWPLMAVCVHDGVDPNCGAEASTAPAPCPRLRGTWDASNAGATPLGAPPLPYVEVRVCYRFTTLFNITDLRLPLGWSISLGNIYLERDREFTVADY